MTTRFPFAPAILALALAAGACERPERTHNDGNQPSGDRSPPSTVDADDARIRGQRDNAGAVSGMPRTPDEASADRTTPPTDAPPTSQSAGPSAAGRVQAAPADDARVPVQEGSRQAPMGHDTSTMADERPEGREPIEGRK